MARLLIACACLLPGHHPAPPAPCPTVGACRAQLVEARRAVAWQRSARRRLARHLRRMHRPAVVEAARLAAQAVGVDPWAMIRVSRCETGGTFDRFSRNPASGALGPWQFLPSTWAHTPFATWSPTNPVAAALATALIVRREGWHQWVCQP